MINVLIIDSGVRNDHPLFSALSISGFAYEKGEVINDFYDSFGHGTAIFNIIQKGCQTLDVNITNIKLSEIENDIDEDDLIDVLRYVDKNLTVDVINLSLGINICERYEDLYEVCKKLSEKGVVLVSAFDNMGSISYPAAFDNVIGVTSKDACRKITDFEYFNDPVITLGAKGGLNKLAWSTPDYIVLSGNSFACAYATVQVIIFMAQGVKSYQELLNKFQEIAIEVYPLKEVKEETIPFEMNRVALFPFNKEMHSLVRFHDLLSFEIVDVYDVKYSMSLGSQTTHMMKDNHVLKKDIKNISSIDWEKIDTLILGHLDELSNLINKQDLMEKVINEAIQNNKKIVAFDDVSNLIEKDNYANVYFPKVTSENVPVNRFGKLYHASKPILGIFGTSSRQGKFTLQLNLRKKLMAIGYKVGQIGTEPSSLLYGMDGVFPMGYNSTVSINGGETVRYINNMINNICRNENDIIVIGSQSGTIAYDYGNISQIPILQHEYLIGTQPDAIVLVVNPFDDIDYITRTINYLEAVSESTVMAIVIFPMDLGNEWSQITRSKKRIDHEKLLKLKLDLSDQFKIPCYSLCDKEIEDLVQEIIEFF